LISFEREIGISRTVADDLKEILSHVENKRFMNGIRIILTNH
jgi:hypothetical protein